MVLPALPEAAIDRSFDTLQGTSFSQGYSSHSGPVSMAESSCRGKEAFKGEQAGAKALQTVRSANHLKSAAPVHSEPSEIRQAQAGSLARSNTLCSVCMG